jgi:hypothetical protein
MTCWPCEADAHDRFDDDASLHVSWEYAGGVIEVANWVVWRLERRRPEWFDLLTVGPDPAILAIDWAATHDSNYKEKMRRSVIDAVIDGVDRSVLADE